MAATDPPPSRSSLRSLDAANLFLAGALSGFGPYIAVFLAALRGDNGRVYNPICNALAGHTATTPPEAHIQAKDVLSSAAEMPRVAELNRWDTQSLGIVNCALISSDRL